MKLEKISDLAILNIPAWIGFKQNNKRIGFKQNNNKRIGFKQNNNKRIGFK
jgi:hypothetical protein